MKAATMLAPALRRAATPRAAQTVRRLATGAEDPDRRVEYRRPTGVEWPDHEGNRHFTQIIKKRMAVFTGTPQDRMPVDPYAPDVTPSQMARLTGTEKEKVQAFSQKLKSWNKKAYEKVSEQVQADIAKQETLAKDADEAMAFAAIMRSWGGDSYKKVDAELVKASEDKRKRLEMAQKLRRMSPQGYAKVDMDAKEEKIKKVLATTEYRKVKGVTWTDAQGKVHDLNIQKKRLEVHLGDGDDLPPPDPYRAGAA